MITKTCKNCGKTFKIFPFRIKEGNGKYCSSYCFHNGYWKNPTPKMIKHIIEAQKLAAKKRIGIKHSDISKEQISENRKGKAIGIKNSRWKGGITKLRISIHGLPEYNIWRYNVFKKDNFMCRECGKQGVYLEAHHHPTPFRDLIRGIKSAQEARKLKTLWEAKGITLCRECHDKTKTFVS